MKIPNTLILERNLFVSSGLNITLYFSQVSNAPALFTLIGFTLIHRAVLLWASCEM